MSKYIHMNTIIYIQVLRERKCLGIITRNFDKSNFLKSKGECALSSSLNVSLMFSTNGNLQERLLENAFS